MSTHDQHADDNTTLAALAIALVEQPRATLQELAKAVGISRATLYRFYQTREKLIERLFAYSTQAFEAGIEKAQLDTAPPLEALRNLIYNHLEHRALTTFLMYYWKEAPKNLDLEKQCNTRLDNFFLRGQQEGFFRIDISAVALTETLVGLMVWLTEAERQGRIARQSLASIIETLFMQGAATDRQPE